MKIPDSMNHPLFFGRDTKRDKGCFREDIVALSFRDAPPLSPEKLKQKLDGWKTEGEKIRQLFSERKPHEASGPLIDQLSCFIQALFWCNNSWVHDLVHWQNTVDNLPVRPVNAVERLELIFTRPSHFTAWIQLNELFSELEKKAASHLRAPRME
ncbi:YpoC family protein [Fictibacillus fluitans]|uniref:YpoC-like domain-containing protein n=1 Tax=Fictibacillus fluitans TaxID=3058422 RepID=A0ABT8HQ20_9BACL|nr:hypothetical protein [Fictibacillus sp. NE201]MDN4522850.1 hypothetical protein [Fictibacillus sp. NE201]